MPSKAPLGTTVALFLCAWAWKVSFSLLRMPLVHGVWGQKKAWPMTTFALGAVRWIMLTLLSVAFLLSTKCFTNIIWWSSEPQQGNRRWGLVVNYSTSEAIKEKEAFQLRCKNILTFIYLRQMVQEIIWEWACLLHPDNSNTACRLWEDSASLQPASLHGLTKAPCTRRCLTLILGPGELPTNECRIDLGKCGSDSIA